MKDLNDIVNEIVEDLDVSADTQVSYEVWAIGHDEEDNATEAELLLGTFEDPDEAVSFAKSVDLAMVVNLAADDDCDVTDQAHSISVEVETVVADDGGDMNIGVIYKKTLEIFEELPEFITLSDDEYEVIEDTSFIQIPRELLKDYDRYDLLTIIFSDEEQPWPITCKIIEKTDKYYICDFA
jgi:hypothetical protein